MVREVGLQFEIKEQLLRFVVLVLVRRRIEKAVQNQRADYVGNVETFNDEHLWLGGGEVNTTRLWNSEGKRILLKRQ